MSKISSQHNHKFPVPDLPATLLYFTLVIMGMLSIYSVSYDLGESAGLFGGGRITSQIMWLGISLGVALLILLFEHSFFQRIAPLLYVSMLSLLIATIFLAPDIKGSHSWLVITDTVRLQPAEFSKVTTSLMLAWWVSQNDFTTTKAKPLLIAFLIILAPMLTIVLQSETGSALVYLGFMLVLYREGLSGLFLLFGGFLVILFVVVLRFSGEMWGTTHAGKTLAYALIYLTLFLATETNSHSRFRYSLRIPALVIPLVVFSVAGIVAIFQPVDFSIPTFISLLLLLALLVIFSIINHSNSTLAIALVGLLSIGLAYGVEYFFEEILQPHQQNRILVSLGMKDDPSGAGYNVRQSLIAIGSGGATGKGYMQGTQTKLNYVPEQDTDFIFCTIGEEFGFFGTTIVLLLYATLLFRIITIAERQSDTFARVYGYCVATIFFFHLMVNVGMVIGLVPVIGIPLPLFSYGGSSLLSFTILLSILLRLDTHNRQTSI